MSEQSDVGHEAGPQPDRLLKNRLFRNSLLSTVVAVLACMSTHVIAILGLAGAVAWLGELEHVLLFLSVALAGLTVYAYFRHRKSCSHVADAENA